MDQNQLKDFLRILQSEIDLRLEEFKSFQDSFSIGGQFCPESFILTLFWMFDFISEELRNEELTLTFLHQPFLKYLRSIGAVKMRGCRRVLVTDLYWSLRDNYKNGINVFIKLPPAPLD